jgi:hypothetical protein
MTCHYDKHDLAFRSSNSASKLISDMLDRNVSCERAKSEATAPNALRSLHNEGLFKGLLRANSCYSKYGTI